MIPLLLALKANKNFLFDSNAGENEDLEKQCLSNKILAIIKFEFTPRDSPQQNGREILWTDAAHHVTDVESKQYGSFPHKACNIPIPKAEYFHQFKEIAIK